MRASSTRRARAAIPSISPAFNQGQFALDNINISAVPEPSTYMLMLAGLGAIGMLSRRRAGKFAASTVQGA